VISAVIFDLDGTLVTFNFDVKGSRRAIIEELSKDGLDMGGLTFTSPTQEIIDRVKSQYTGDGGVGFASVRRRIYSILDGFEGEGAQKAVPFGGTRQALEELRSRCLRLALLTNSGRAATSTLLSRYNLGYYFEFVLTRDEVDEMKPSPSGLLQAVSRFRLPGSAVCYVGDGLLDIIAAKRAGVSMVAVASGNYGPERLRSEGADYVLNAISDLPSLLTGI